MDKLTKTALAISSLLTVVMWFIIVASTLGIQGFTI